MSRVTDTQDNTEGMAAAGVPSAGDEAAFTKLMERYRRELHLHCYRMLASFEDAEDVVQETFLRAWKSRASFQARSSYRAWLYRIATNACLDFIERDSKRGVPRDPNASPLTTEIAWLQPYPDRLLDEIASSSAEPEAAVVAKETIALAFLVAIQLLPPKQRATLILRDVLGWSAKETASVLAPSVASVNSALQRARLTLKQRIPLCGDESQPTASRGLLSPASWGSRVSGDGPRRAADRGRRDCGDHNVLRPQPVRDVRPSSYTLMARGTFRARGGIS